MTSISKMSVDERAIRTNTNETQRIIREYFNIFKMRINILKV
jgi:hypothetical protein